MNCRFISEKNFTTFQRFFGKEIEKFQKTLPTFENPSRRFQESPICFGIRPLKNVKWLPKIEGVTEKLKKTSRGSFSQPDLSMQARKGHTKYVATIPLKAWLQLYERLICTNDTLMFCT